MSASRLGHRQAWYKMLYVQVLIAIVAGVVLGSIAPETAKSLKGLGDAFVALIRMMIAPVIFCTIVHGISSMAICARPAGLGSRRYSISRSCPPSPC